jgi:hypothetical protein
MRRSFFKMASAAAISVARRRAATHSGKPGIRE